MLAMFSVIVNAHYSIQARPRLYLDENAIEYIICLKFRGHNSGTENFKSIT